MTSTAIVDAAVSSSSAAVSGGGSGAVRRVRVYTAKQVAQHASLDHLWLSRKGKVYDVTAFALDHPGGEELVMRYAGRDMGEAMQDPEEHEHSDAAYELLEEHCIGRLATTAEEEAAAAAQQAGNANEALVITEDFHPEESDVKADFASSRFLDLSKPLIRQVWESSFSKDFYLQQVHAPRHLRESARLFGPQYLEVLTRTPWYIVPIVWLPIAAALFWRSLHQFAEVANVRRLALQSLAPHHANATEAAMMSLSSPSSSSVALTGAVLTKTLACFLAGNVIWTILEYTLHRFLFHIDVILPDRPFFLMLHFLLHGIHHYLPMDRLRLVMPPILFAALSFPFTQLAHVLFPARVANGIISGAFVFYVLYDTMHYALHHTKLPAYLRAQKKYHLEHHYKNSELGFGVTSKFWDWIFGTLL